MEGVLIVPTSLPDKTFLVFLFVPLSRICSVCGIYLCKLFLFFSAPSTHILSVPTAYPLKRSKGPDIRLSPSSAFLLLPTCAYNVTSSHRKFRVFVNFQKTTFWELGPCFNVSVVWHHGVHTVTKEFSNPPTTCNILFTPSCSYLFGYYLTPFGFTILRFVTLAIFIKHY